MSMAGLSPLGRLTLSHVLLSVMSLLIFVIIGDEIVFKAMLWICLLHVLALASILYVQRFRWFYLAISKAVPKSKAVTLIDFEGDLYHTLAQQDDLGSWHCPLNYLTRTGRCMLLPDGTVDPLSPSSYIRYWKPMSTDELVLHQLVNDMPDISMMKKRTRRVQR